MSEEDRKLRLVSSEVLAPEALEHLEASFARGNAERPAQGPPEALPVKSEADLEFERLVRRGLPAALVRELAYRPLPAPTRAMTVVRRFMAQQPSGEKHFHPLLVLAGGKGCGKSTAAAWAAGRRPTEPCYGKGLNSWPSDLVTRFILADQLAAVSRYDQVDRKAYEDCWLLVIDDLGAEYDDSKGAFRSFLGAILTKRHDHELRTIITTNLPLKLDGKAGQSFSERYGDPRVLDRIGKGFIVVDAPSLRGQDGT